MNIHVSQVFKAHKRIRQHIVQTPLIRLNKLSSIYGAEVYVKRQDLQCVRSFKIRGALNKILSMEGSEEICTVSAGNHAQGVAFSCRLLKRKGYIVMPRSTPQIKVENVKFWGKQYVEVILHGQNISEAEIKCNELRDQGKILVHPFNDEKVIIGQGTIAIECVQKIPNDIDYFFCCVGGGGMLSGVSIVLKSISPDTKIIGFEPKGCPSMYNSLKENRPVKLEKYQNFIDGAAVGNTGDKTFNIIRQLEVPIKLVDQGLACKFIIDLFNEEQIIAEPAGALALSGLQIMKEQIKGKTVVCVLSGSNNDIARMSQIRRRSLIYQRVEKYYLINFYQKTDSLKLFLSQGVVEEDDVVQMSFTKQTLDPSKGPCLVGLRFAKVGNDELLENWLNKQGVNFTEVKPGDSNYKMLL